MFPFLKSLRNPQRAQHALPEGERVYAIGDIHGRLDLFGELLAKIDRDDEERAPAKTTIILLGDLINRGPNSAGVIRKARELCVERGIGRVVKGNHEEIFVKAASGSGKAARMLWQMGGDATLLSYGFSREEAENGTFQELAERMAERIPDEDVAFLGKAEDWITKGDYLFVHAGIRPGVPVDQQTSADLRWIREKFLNAKRNDDTMVVHGHTPTRSVDERPDRLGVDTGAYMWGVLTAVGIEDTDRWFLEAREG
ncbi:metallophosphoesterase family protein [Stakelama marina]|uniref:Serine/threonine protein phosphatase n=1 Tax=Stakelama marina TaxID=2826939 RepID=A0A8T4IHA6_9SPHN|nr:metallophosphoesterase family protein [Stakelama marina]MBR0553940.1 serine/threonine protein phosphatase [Stakelama marina]